MTSWHQGTLEAVRHGRGTAKFAASSLGSSAREPFHDCDRGSPRYEACAGRLQDGASPGRACHQSFRHRIEWRSGRKRMRRRNCGCLHLRSNRNCAGAQAEGIGRRGDGRSSICEEIPGKSATPGRDRRWPQPLCEPGLDGACALRCCGNSGKLNLRAGRFRFGRGPRREGSTVTARRSVRCE